MDLTSARPDLHWETETGFVEMICGALGDRRLLPDSPDAFPFPEQSRGVVPGPDGTGMIVFMVTEDGIPVEIARAGGPDGAIVGARIECVSDVDEVEASGNGEWQTLATFSVGEGQAVACDPSHRGLLADRVEPLPLVAGEYVAQSFYGAGDTLGIRILLAHG